MIHKISRKRKMFIGAVFLVAGLSGTVFFFPVNLNSRYTCLYHRMFADKNQAQMAERHTMMSHNHEKNCSENMQKMANVEMNQSESEVNHAELLNLYILPFGFFWWFSLAILFIGVYMIYKNHLRRSMVFPVNHL